MLKAKEMLIKVETLYLYMLFTLSYIGGYQVKTCFLSINPGMDSGESISSARTNTPGLVWAELI